MLTGRTLSFKFQLIESEKGRLAFGIGQPVAELDAVIGGLVVALPHDQANQLPYDVPPSAERAFVFYWLGLIPFQLYFLYLPKSSPCLFQKLL